MPLALHTGMSFPPQTKGYGEVGEHGTIVPSYVMPRLPHRRFEEVLARSQTMPPTGMRILFTLFVLSVFVFDSWFAQCLFARLFVCLLVMFCVYEFQ